MTFYYNDTIYSKSELLAQQPAPSTNRRKMTMRRIFKEMQPSNNAWYRMSQGKTDEK